VGSGTSYGTSNHVSLFPAGNKWRNIVTFALQFTDFSDFSPKDMGVLPIFETITAR
jgi:hypothetical protein